MADWSVKYDSFRLDYVNFPCMNIDSTISIFFLCAFEANNLFWFIRHRFRACAKIISHFRRRCIPPGCVAKTLNMLDIHAFSRLVSRALQRQKLRTYFRANP